MQNPFVIWPSWNSLYNYNSWVVQHLQLLQLANQTKTTSTSRKIRIWVQVISLISNEIALVFFEGLVLLTFSKYPLSKSQLLSGITVFKPPDIPFVYCLLRPEFECFAVKRVFLFVFFYYYITVVNYVLIPVKIMEIILLL